MRTLQIAIYSGFLAVVNLVFIFLGFAVARETAIRDTVAVQVSIAAVACIVAFVLFVYVVGRVGPRRLALARRSDLLLIGSLSLVWAPTIFVTLHYATQGYLTSSENIVGLWVFQVPTNALAV